ncbi:MAG: quinohemoprotein amine dehydrogenase maturation protein [Acidobacteria bacterium]|nr:quinohemoprotein amine dehydrogenase maturation protein [Acidobacteriota bacterium]
MTHLALREHHRFEAAGKPYLFLVPSAAVVGLDAASDMVMQVLASGEKSRADLLTLADGLFSEDEIDGAIHDLVAMRAIGPIEPQQPMPKILPLTPVPLGTMVLNVTNQCNLACTYCYEYGEDKIVDTDNGKQPKFMSIETAKQSVEFMLKESGEAKTAHLTFFGGETLLNFKVLKETIAYARQRAAELGKDVDFSLTTNATLLKPDVIEYLVQNQVGVTISFDGPPEVQNKFRVFHNGTGSYDIVAPKIKELLQKHRRRPVGARVTLTSGNLDVKGIYRHLTEEFGFREVGFAPVTTSAKRTYALDEQGYDHMLAQFTALAEDFKEAAIEGRHHGFSNVKETIQEIHQGMSKAYPCGAGIGLMGVSTAGDVALCHRFAGSDTHKLGTVRDGVDRAAQTAFLESHHLANKTDCSTCWARPVCSGGCYHEAHTRYGDTTKANLHYCDWIRSWTEVCLKVYAEIAEKNSAWLAQFDREPAAEKVS